MIGALVLAAFVSASADGRDRTADVNRAIDLVRLAGGGTVELEKGTYRFDAQSALPFSFYISNHDQSATHPVLFPILGATNVTLRGNGSTFLVDGRTVPFYMRDSKNVRIEGIALDAVRPVITEARILCFDGKHPIVRIDRAKYPYEVIDGRLQMLGNGWKEGVGCAMAFEGTSGAIVAGTGDLPYRGNVKELGDGELELAYDFQTAGVGMTAGDVIAFRPNSRPYPAIVIERSADTVLTDVIVHDAQGMALVAQHAENVTWRGNGRPEDRRSGVFPSAGKFASTHADATHFSNVKGLVRIENCLFQGMMDDAINVHSTAIVIEALPARDRVRCRFKHRQAYGFDLFLPGEKARFVRGLTLENGPVRPVLAVNRIRPDELELTVEGGVPEGFSAGDAVENADYQPSVVFCGNVVRNNRARAALFTTLRPVVCASNCFERVSGSAILLAGDAQKWYETGACSDVAVFANVFSNCCASAACHGYCKGVVSICPTVRDAAGQRTSYHRNVRIEDNVFFTFDVPLLYATSADEVRFRRNRVVRNADYAGWGQPAIITEGRASVYDN